MRMQPTSAFEKRLLRPDAEKDILLALTNERIIPNYRYRTIIKICPRAFCVSSTRLEEQRSSNTERGAVAFSFSFFSNAKCVPSRRIGIERERERHGFKLIIFRSRVDRRKFSRRTRGKFSLARAETALVHAPRKSYNNHPALIERADITVTGIGRIFARVHYFSAWHQRARGMSEEISENPPVLYPRAQGTEEPFLTAGRVRR